MTVNRLSHILSAAVPSWPVAVAFAVAVSMAVPAKANVFDVSGVAVGVTADSAAAAREAAIIKGQRRAFEKLVARLTLPEDRAFLPSLDSTAITGLVKDISVAEEKTSSVRYLGLLNVRFSADDVRALFTSSAVPWAETSSRPMLVLPLYETAGARLLWDEPNPWREAWAARLPLDGLVPMLLPEGDLRDVATIGVEQARGGDPDGLAAIARRYGVEEVVIAAATLGRPALGGGPQLRVSLERFGPNGIETLYDGTLSADDEDAEAELLTRGVDAATGAVTAAWKRANLLQTGSNTVTAMATPVTRLEDWLAIRRSLDGVSVVRRVDVVVLSRRQVRMNVHYQGDGDQLAAAMAQAGLTLDRSGDPWVVWSTRAGSDDVDR